MARELRSAQTVKFDWRSEEEVSRQRRVDCLPRPRPANQSDERTDSMIVDNMQNPMNNFDETIYLKKNAIDRSVVYLVGGIVILLFFLLTVMGRGRLQQNVSGPTNRVGPVPPSSEIGGDSVGDVSR
jgi:hypothetical protein